MAMQKAHENQNWENYPSINTPLNEQNLNKLDHSVDEIDDRVIRHEEIKATKEEVAPLITSVEFNEKTGVFTFTRKNGAKFTIDTLLETILTNWTYDKDTQQLILTMENGEKQYVDLSELITQYEFLETETISLIVDKEGKVSAIVKEGSINEKHLRPDYLADIRVESAKAEAAKEAAQVSEANAKKSETAAATSATQSANSAKESADSATASAGSATTATEQATSASNSAKAAQTSATNAATSASTATTQANAAKSSATAAATSATNASTQATNAKNSATQAAASATTAKSYAEGGTGSRQGEDTDNAKEYARQAKASADKAAEIVAGDYIPSSQKGMPNGVATLDSAGKVPTTQLPDNIGKVQSVNGKTGAVTITKADVGLGSVGNFKAVSTVENQGLSATEQSNARENIGLGNVDNTADANKSVKSATTATTASKVAHALTFTGAVTGNYDGSATKSVAIPKVLNVLNSSDTASALSAAQGKALNDKFGTLTFGKTTDGKWGYRVGGADPVIPFKTGGGDVTIIYMPEFITDPQAAAYATNATLTFTDKNYKIVFEDDTDCDLLLSEIPRTAFIGIRLSTDNNGYILKVSEMKSNFSAVLPAFIDGGFSITLSGSWPTRPIECQIAPILFAKTETFPAGKQYSGMLKMVEKST